MLTEEEDRQRYLWSEAFNREGFGSGGLVHGFALDTHFSLPRILEDCLSPPTLHLGVVSHVRGILDSSPCLIGEDGAFLASWTSCIAVAIWDIDGVYTTEWLIHPIISWNLPCFCRHRIGLGALSL